MKKLFTSILVMALTLIMVACSQTPQPVIPNGTATPDWSDAEAINAEYSWLPTFTDGGLEHNDWDIVIADVTINGWLDEVTDYLTSYYSVKINDVLYGEIPRDTIVIEKTGNTKYTDTRYPLMEQGERLIVVLVKNPEAWLPYEKYREQTGKEPPKWMQETIVYSLYEYCDVVEDSGNLYVLDRNGTLTEELPSNEISQIDAGLKAGLVDRIQNEYRETKFFSYPHAFTYDSFVALIDEYTPGK